MITIGEFASLGRVSVRMLRHYDAIGLLVPARVDPHTSYRFYELDQLRRLNRIVALKDLGLTLDIVARIVDGVDENGAELDADALRGMYRLRMAQLDASIRSDQQRLARVSARLRLVEQENAMPTTAVTTATVAATRWIGLADVAAAATNEDIGPVVSSMFPRVVDALTHGGTHPAGPAVAYYCPAPHVSEDALTVHATFPVASLAGAPQTVAGLESFDVPAGEYASLIHRGSMDTIDATYQLLRRWVTEQGRTLNGEARETYLEMSGAQEEWVTEVQIGFAR